MQMVAGVSYIFMWVHCTHKLGNPGETGVKGEHITKEATHIHYITKYST